MTMWAHPAWNQWAGARPSPQQPGPRERVMARVRHPSFTPELAEAVVRDLSRRHVRLLWEETARLLASPIDAGLRFNLVLLREQLLDRELRAEMRQARAAASS